MNIGKKSTILVRRVLFKFLIQEVSALLFKLLFVFAFVLSTFSGKEIELSGEHNLSSADASLVTVDEISIPDFDLDDPFAVDNTHVSFIADHYTQSTSSYSQPYLPLQHIENTQSRAPPALYS